MAMIGKSGLTWRYGIKTEAELIGAEMRAHTLPPATEHRAVRCIDFVNRHFGEMHYIFIFDHDDS